jgi:hypothetical protein
MEAQPSNKAHRIITTIFFLVIYLAHHSRNQRDPLFPPFARGDTGGCKKALQTCPHENGEKKFLQGNTITHTKTLKQTQLIYFERL